MSLRRFPMRSALISVLAAGLLASAASVRAEPAPFAAPAAPAPFTRELALDRLNRALTGHFNLEGELQLDFIRPWQPPARVAAEWDLQVVEFPTVATSSMMLRCRLLADASPVGELSLVLRAQLWRDAWATRQPVALGTTFDPAMLEVRRVDLFRDREALPAAVGDRQFAFARAVSAGRLLTWRDVARRPLVRKGELVEVAAMEGPLLVTMKALALENGAQGETVTVRNPQSRKDFAAMVVAENRVQVRF